MHRTRKRWHRIQEWWAAGNTAARELRRERGILRAGWILVRVFWLVGSGYLFGRLVSRRVWWKRIHGGCYHCVIFSRATHTCGSAGLRQPDGRQVGCLCWMAFKARFKSSQCWLNDFHGCSGAGPWDRVK
jgi:hypothetical protein